MKNIADVKNVSMKMAMAITLPMPMPIPRRHLLIGLERKHQSIRTRNASIAHIVAAIITKSKTVITLPNQNVQSANGLDTRLKTVASKRKRRNLRKIKITLLWK